MSLSLLNFSDCNCVVLLFCSENDITGVIDSTFTVQHEVFGEMKTFELKPGGSDIAVTQESKREYAK